jgi:hypothetical protein
MSTENLTDRLARLREEAVYAVERADYQTAHAKLLAAQVIYDTTPNQEKDSLRLEFRSIEALMRRIEAKLRGTRITRLPVEYIGPEDGEMYYR